MKNKQPTNPELVTEEIASNISFIAAGMKQLRAGRLNDKAINILLYHACGRSVSMNTIQLVLRELELLEKTYLKGGIK
jgi:hypothetical protein